MLLLSSILADTPGLPTSLPQYGLAGTLLAVVAGVLWWVLRQNESLQKDLAERNKQLTDMLVPVLKDAAVALSATAASATRQSDTISSLVSEMAIERDIRRGGPRGRP